MDNLKNVRGWRIQIGWYETSANVLVFFISWNTYPTKCKPWNFSPKSHQYTELLIYMVWSEHWISSYFHFSLILLWIYAWHIFETYNLIWCTRYMQAAEVITHMVTITSGHGPYNICFGYTKSPFLSTRILLCLYVDKQSLASCMLVHLLEIKC